ncbi:hypothetical protein F5141DRAFT_1221206 [Pisolithus sp. B1]|nr:hypothetical protein F5141DRAFT_1221206 [Pisolithus sp. B1]
MKKCSSLQAMNTGVNPASELADPMMLKPTRKHGCLVLRENASTRQSSRANKGSGGQLLQLKNIEWMQTELTVRPMPTEAATANEPLNPLAPVSTKQTPRSHHLKGGQVVSSHAVLPAVLPMHSLLNPVAHYPPLPQVQHVSTAGSQYGFHLPSLTPDSTLCCDNSTAPRSVLTAPSSRQGSLLPPSCSSSAVPLSRNKAHTTLAVSSPVPLRSSQISQQAQNSQSCILSRTFSVHDLASSQLEYMSLHAPLPYSSNRSELNDTKSDNDNFPFKCMQNSGPNTEGLDANCIDEVSSNEDDRMAEAALHAPKQPTQDSQPQDVDPNVCPMHQVPLGSQIDPVLLANMEQYSNVDVVHAHHQHNGFPHVPAPEHLCELWGQQWSSIGSVASDSASNVPGLPQDAQPPAVDCLGIAQTTGMAVNGQLIGQATKLCSYLHKFREVIKWAKLISQCESMTKDPFPSQSTFLDQIGTEIFNKAILQCKNVPAWYWPNYHKDLCILLWESLMMWHSIIKGKAHKILTRFYNIGKHRSNVENQLEAQLLIKGAVFLRDGVDDKGSTNNMAHPALAALITDFLYAPSSLSIAFPEDRPFKYIGYSKVFASFLDMQHQIDSVPKHASKMKALHITWAMPSGMPSKSGPLVVFSDEFGVILD